jgi:hypothetical protein
VGPGAPGRATGAPRTGRGRGSPSRGRYAGDVPTAGARVLSFPTRRALAAWLVANAGEVTVLKVRPRHPAGVMVRYLGTARPAAKGLIGGKRRPTMRSRSSPRP